MLSISQKLKEYIDRKKAKAIEGLSKLEHNSDEYSSLSFQIEDKFNYLSYIKARAEEAGAIELGTHIARYIHSSTKTSNIVAIKGTTLTTVLDSNSIENLSLDYYCNAAYSPTGEILTLQDDFTNRYFFEYAFDDDIELFDFLDISDSEKLELCVKFKKCLKNNKSITVDQLVKNIYFPSEDGYKILIPLFPSALYQKIYERLKSNTENNFKKNGPRDAFRQKMSHDEDYIFFKDLASIKVGGANAQNVSRFNSLRGGSVRLFSCAPPSLSFSSIKLKGKSNIFHEKSFTYLFKYQLYVLSDFILKNKNNNYNDNLRSKRQSFIDEIVDIVLASFSYIKDSKLAGWTDSSQIMSHQKAMIDKKYSNLNRSDHLLSFKQVCDDFAYYCVTTIDFILNDRFSLGDNTKENLENIFSKTMLQRNFMELK